MKDLSNTLLKNGLQNLIYDDEEAFKKSLVDTLSLKLNEAISEVEKSFKAEMLNQEEKTSISEDMNYFIQFLENYDSKIKNTLRLKNSTVINIKENEFFAIKKLFDSLNSQNRKKLVESCLADSKSFKQNIDFCMNARKTLP